MKALKLLEWKRVALGTDHKPTNLIVGSMRTFIPVIEPGLRID